jgi:hypothetical protein
MKTKKRRKSDVTLKHLRPHSLKVTIFSPSTVSKNMSSAPEHSTEKDPSAILWPTFDVPQAPRAIVVFPRSCELLC